MKCDDCKFAEWKRTKSGALHPGKNGNCTFEKDVPMPHSMPAYGFNHNRKVIEIRGGWIERGRAFETCAYYGPVQP